MKKIVKKLEETKDRWEVRNMDNEKKDPQKSKSEMDKIGENLESNGSFRIQNSRLLLTYKTHLDKNEYIEWIKKKKDIKEIYMAHETGDKDVPYEHTHVLVWFKQLFQSRNARILDYENIHPHIRKVNSQKHWSNAVIYMAKEDPENEGLLTQNRPLIDKIQECSSESDALRNFVVKPMDYSSVRQIYRDREREISKVYIDPNDYKSWQIVFNKIYNQNKNPGRVVNWLFDEKGGCGKTQWAYHMVDNFPDSWIVIKNIGKIQDFIHNIKNFAENGWNGRGIIIDLPRASYDSKDIYQCLELIIDGRMTSTKYTGGSITIGNPHVWVFSNFMPKIKLLSLDRWRILKVRGKGKAVRLMKYGIKEKTGDIFHSRDLTIPKDGIIGLSFNKKDISAGSSSISSDEFDIEEIDEDI